jgi:hypothetical protein
VSKTVDYADFDIDFGGEDAFLYVEISKVVCSFVPEPLITR